ncbi:hypothetical protein GJ744_009923 [Endocarpon pusillum]|uniref:FAM192A/Fyv6 N-terminal domain-containing protein n=1 Tax=Endocarpon pusillum TaxID=364733 RepID=A0A8H7AJ72_9EURO|nr:hypothetical protein GJ744_009923 [Endocarpon pusillum]
MSSGFVLAGSEETQPGDDDGWLKARQAIEETRRPEQKHSTQGGKSLYEVLQQKRSE